jgi:hypothetical protein
LREAFQARRTEATVSSNNQVLDVFKAFLRPPGFSGALSSLGDAASPAEVAFLSEEIVTQHV